MKASFTYNKIVNILLSSHGTNTSVLTLHRILWAYGMRRKNTSTDIDMSLGFISNELLTSSSHIKCRIMHQHLCASNIVADKETVRITLNLLNLEGVVLR